MQHQREGVHVGRMLHERATSQRMKRLIEAAYIWALNQSDWHCGPVCSGRAIPLRTRDPSTLHPTDFIFLRRWLSMARLSKQATRFRVPFFRTTQTYMKERWVCMEQLTLGRGLN